MGGLFLWSGIEKTLCSWLVFERKCRKMVELWIVVYVDTSNLACNGLIVDTR